MGNHCVFLRFAIDQIAFGTAVGFLGRFFHGVRCFFSVSAKILSLDGAFGLGEGAVLGSLGCIADSGSSEHRGWWKP